MHSLLLKNNNINIFLLLFIASIFTSCVVEKEENQNTNKQVEVIANSDILKLEYEIVDVFFHSTNFRDRFIGIKNNQELEIPVSLDLKFDIPKNSYGFRAGTGQLIQLNDRYDLIQGSVTKFLKSQNITRNDTIYAIKGFSEVTKGEYLLFDKQNLTFIELEDGFWTNMFVDKKVQVLDNKLYYIKKTPLNSTNEIRYIDLDDLTLSPQTLHTSSDIISFLINNQMDIYIESGIGIKDKYISHLNGQVLEFDEADYPLKLNFVGEDGKFYAQKHSLGLDRTAEGFYSIEIQNNQLIGSSIFSFNHNKYPGTLYLGNATRTIPNSVRKNNVIIDGNSGINTMNFYELNTATGNINRLNTTLDYTYYTDYKAGDFFIIKDVPNKVVNYRLRKFAFSDLHLISEIYIGNIDNGIILNQNNSSVYSLKTNNKGSSFIELKSDNSVNEIPLTTYHNGYFSIIN